MERVLKVVAISIALALAGCSLFMKTNPENWEPRLAPTCSDRKTAPLLDTIAAGAGVAAASYGAVCLSLEDGDTARERCTRFALVPGIASALLYGVPALDHIQGCSILSGDQIAPFVATRLGIATLIHATDVDGVFETDPALDPSARRIARIDHESWDEVRLSLDGSRAVDVTGGMAGKIAALMELARGGLGRRGWGHTMLGSTSECGDTLAWPLSSPWLRRVGPSPNPFHGARFVKCVSGVFFLNELGVLATSRRK